MVFFRLAVLIYIWWRPRQAGAIGVSRILTTGRTVISPGERAERIKAKWIGLQPPPRRLARSEPSTPRKEPAQVGLESGPRGRRAPMSPLPGSGVRSRPSCGSGACPEPTPPRRPAFDSPREPLPRTAAAGTRGLNGRRRRAERDTWGAGNTWGAGAAGARGRERLALPGAWRPRGRALLSPMPPLRVRALPGAGRAPRPPGRPGSGRGGACAGGDRGGARGVQRAGRRAQGWRPVPG